MKAANRSKFRYSDSKDENVERIQNRLQALGFDVGEIDGHFGYLTREAVRECQIAYKLKADGIVGRSMLELLSSDIFPSRLSYVASEGETLKTIASACDTTVEAILEANVEKTYRPVYKGERLHIYKRMLINACSVPSDRCTFNFVDAFSLNSQGVIELASDLKVPEKALLVIKDENIEGTWLFLKKGPQRQSLEKLTKKVVELGAKGVVLDFSNVEEPNSERFTRFVAKFAEETKRRNLKICVCLPPEVFLDNESPIKRGYDVPMLAKSSDFMVAQYPVGKCFELDLEKYNEPKFFREWIEKVCKDIPRWKAIVSVYLGKYKYVDGAVSLVSEEEVESIKAKHYTRNSHDERIGISYFRYRAKGKYVRIWSEDKKSFAFKLHQINRFNVVGIALRGLNFENEDILAEVQKKFIII